MAVTFSLPKFAAIEDNNNTNTKKQERGDCSAVHYTCVASVSVHTSMDALRQHDRPLLRIGEGHGTVKMAYVVVHTCRRNMFDLRFGLLGWSEELS